MVTISSPLMPSDCHDVPSSKTSGRTPMPTRLERWMRSKLWAMTARTPRRRVPLAAQSRDEPVPYSLPAKMTSGTPSACVAHGGVVDRHDLAVGLVGGDAAFDAGDHLVLDADVGEGAAHHHLVIAAARAVLVEVVRAHLMLEEIVRRPGSSRLIEPAGEMWSVVIESRKRPRMRAPTMSVIGSGFIVMPSK